MSARRPDTRSLRTTRNARRSLAPPEALSHQGPRRVPRARPAQSRTSRTSASARHSRRCLTNEAHRHPGAVIASTVAARGAGTQYASVSQRAAGRKAPVARARFARRHGRSLRDSRRLESACESLVRAPIEAQVITERVIPLTGQDIDSPRSELVRGVRRRAAPRPPSRTEEPSWRPASGGGRPLSARGVHRDQRALMRYPPKRGSPASPNGCRASTFRIGTAGFEPATP